MKKPETLLPRATGAALVALALGLGGCSGLGSLGLGDTPTASIAPPAPKIDPACAGLRSQIDGLNKEGIAEKLDKASQKKTKLTAAELAKVSQLMKAKDQYTAKCPQQAAAMANEPPMVAPALATAPKQATAAAQTTTAAAVPAVSQAVAKAKAQ